MNKTKVLLELTQDEFFIIRLALSYLEGISLDGNSEADKTTAEEARRISIKLRKTAKYEYTKAE